MNLVVGINACHPDAAACALKEGRVVAAVAEERLGPRVKHAAGFPGRALNAVLEMAGATLADVDCLAVGNDPNANLGLKVQHVLKAPLRSARGVATHFARRARMRGLRQLAAEACGQPEAHARFRVVRVEHHLAHLASSFFTSDFEEAAGFSYDGAGDFTTTLLARCQGNRIQALERVAAPHSLGFFYTALSQFIGFDRFGEEYKVMGLGACGEPAHLEFMRELVQVNGEGLFRLNPAYFRPLARSLEECVDEKGEVVLPPLYSAELERRLGARRQRGAELSRRDKDLAASCQARFEEVVLASLRRLHERVRVPNLVTAGGCALNGLCNARLLRDSPFHRSHTHGAASDDGTALGAALYVWHCLLNRPRSPALEDPFLGPEHTESEMETALRQAGVPFERLSRAALLERAVGLLARGCVVGWYQGRSEWGPRALGNRSILAHPGWPGMQELLNGKIKRRETFRPFAPSVLAEAAADLFEQGVASPFMMHVVKIRAGHRSALAAVCHADATARLHTVSRGQNPLYYDLLRAFARRTGLPALLNTSFNENEPIVDSPAQALACFRRTGIDALCLGPFVTVKPGQGKILPTDEH